MFHQSVEQRVAARLDHQGDRATAVGFLHRFQPAVQRLGAGFDLAGLQFAPSSRLVREGVRLVSPIQGHEGRIVGCIHGCYFLVWRARAAGRIVRGVGDAGS